MDEMLHIERLPIERHWAIAMKLHELLGHEESWEICRAGCDELAAEAILTVFGGAWALPPDRDRLPAMPDGSDQ